MATADQLLFALTLVAAVGCGLVAGVFFAFSAFVMKALARLPSGEGIAAKARAWRTAARSQASAARFGLMRNRPRKTRALNNGL